MDPTRLPPLDFPLALNPTPAPPNLATSSRELLITRAILPFSLLVDYIGPHSPLSWSRPTSPGSPHRPLPGSAVLTANGSPLHRERATPPASRTPRSRSRSFRLRTRSSPIAVAHPSMTVNSAPALCAGATEPPMTPPASPLSRPGHPPLASLTCLASGCVTTGLSCGCSESVASTANGPLATADESQKVVKVVASHGRTGDQIELSYSSTKVVGNGSFGVVFAAKLAPNTLGPDNEGDDEVAIKKVLQDKRFKASSAFPVADRSMQSLG